MRHTLSCAIQLAGRRTAELIQIGSASGRSGQELVEYALMVGFIAVSVAAFIPYSVTGPISTIFSKIAGYLVQLGNG